MTGTHSWNRARSLMVFLAVVSLIEALKVFGVIPHTDCLWKIYAGAFAVFLLMGVSDIVAVLGRIAAKGTTP